MKIKILIVAAAILFDIITGVIKGLCTTGLNSTAFREGMYHKLSELIALGGSLLVECGISFTGLQFDIHLSTALVTYILIMEIISSLENIAAVNPELGNFFAPYLAKLKQSKEDMTNDIDSRPCIKEDEFHLDTNSEQHDQ